MIRLVITVMSAVSQWEREAIGERTRGALQHKRGNGERIGNIEFGYRLSPDRRHLEPDPTEQAAVEQIRDLRRRGQTLRGIAATLKRSGPRTRLGTEWRLESVARVIKQNGRLPTARTA
jgi:DNA invertase Pin-like site-specific DNA recombinase